MLLLPSSQASIVLTGSAALRLRLFVPEKRDEPNGSTNSETELVAVEYHGPFEVSLCYGVGAARTEPVRLRWPSRGDPMVYRGIVPEDPTLIVTAPGWPPVEMQVRGLRPSETRTVEARIGIPVPLVGRVVDAEGRPRAGIEVQATPGTAPGHEWSAQRLESMPSGMGTGGNRGPGRFDAATVTDAEGRFEFAGFAASAVTLRVAERPWVDLVETVQHPAEVDVVLTCRLCRA